MKSKSWLIKVLSNNCLKGMVALCMLSLGTVAYAADPDVNVQAQQTKKVTGTVVDSTGEPVIGATVAQTGTTNGTVTDIDGNFTLSVPANATITISYIGFETQVVTVGAQSNITVTLKDDSQALDEVVVTALGIKREKKALGYAMQEVKGDELLAARENNLANALSGKVSGVQIIRSSNGPAGSSKILLRGSSSLTGTNQPLIVVDGTPLENFTGADNNDFWNPSTDMGNGLSDINAEDIESMSVLKGASAAALYGSRAGNGVILITTKKGAKKQGLGITVSSSVSIEDVFMKPDRQNVFGQGSGGAFDAQSGENWGPKIEGQTYQDKDGNNFTYQYYDNVKNFFNTGVNATENVSFSQVYNKTAVYSSFTRLDDFSKIPGAEYKRTNVMTRVSSTFGPGDRWNFDGKVQYINSYAKNRPVSGQNSNNYFYNMYMLPMTIDIAKYRDAINPEDGKMYWWQKGGMNPYWAADNVIGTDSRNRFLMNYSLKYNFTDWLNAELRFGSDMYFTETENKEHSGGPNTDKGTYGFGESKFYENNLSFLVTAQKDNVIDKFGGVVTFGGNLMQRKSTGLSAGVRPLTVPDMFWISNGAQADKSISQSYSQRKTNSLYGTLGVNYDAWMFVDATFRNDWSSTLSKENRSFFYPSVNASVLVSELVNKNFGGMPEWFNYAKARVSFAQVGNDLAPYQLLNTYSSGSDGNVGTSTAWSGGTLFSSDVRSELISSWEAGAEIRFFNNRLGLDFTWYKSNATRQLLSLPMNSLSGYSRYMANAGNIQNTGLEIMLNATPVQTKDFSWDTQLNFSKNNNKIIELANGIEQYQLGGYDNLQIVAQVGGNYGEIWGTTFLRVEDENSPYYGKLLLTSDGLPQGKSDKVKIGDQQADFLLGWTNTLTYKNFVLSFLIDGRFGGQMYSGTNRALQSNGTAACTVVNGARDNFVVEGVIADGNGGYVQNDKEVSPQQYWRTISSATGNLGIGEAYLYDATNIRLRNVSMAYNFPKAMLKSTPFQQLKVGVTATNLLMFYSKMNGVDPESVFATNTNATGFENYSSPTSRTFLFNVTVGF